MFEIVRERLHATEPGQWAQILAEKQKLLLELLGHDNWGDTKSNEKTVLGTAVESGILKTFDFIKPGVHCDYSIDGYEVDNKFTIGKNWCIPPNHANALLLLEEVNCTQRKFRVGLVQCEESLLNVGFNRDSKRTLSMAGRASIDWFIPTSEY